MATRIVHISDLHFPAANSDQVDALQRSIIQMAPDIIVVTGDLTRSGKNHEFRQAKSVLDSFRAPTLIVPGNHDIPVPGIWARLDAPFRRFEHYFPSTDCFLETPDLLVVALNTAVGFPSVLDWSLGYVKAERLAEAARTLSTRRGGRVGIVASHHPLHPHPNDPVRSRTAGGPAAFDKLSSAGMDLLLHGHLHRADRRCFQSPGTLEACQVCANTALANRERDGPSGFNIIDAEGRNWVRTVLAWSGDHYSG